jgi:hypothetical protein
MIVLGMAFIYIPLFDFLESQSGQKHFSESEKADIQSIRESHGEIALTDAVNRLMSRPDVARVHVMIGEYDYPAFEIKRGKNVRPGEIGRHANVSEHGYMVYIGYTRDSMRAPSERQEIKDSIRSLGSVVGGLFLVFMGIINIAVPTEKLFARHEEKSSPIPSPPAPQPSHQSYESQTPQPVKRFGELKLVRSGDDSDRTAS